MNDYTLAEVPKFPPYKQVNRVWHRVWHVEFSVPIPSAVSLQPIAEAACPRGFSIEVRRDSRSSAILTVMSEIHPADSRFLGCTFEVLRALENVVSEINTIEGQPRVKWRLLIGPK